MTAPSSRILDAVELLAPRAGEHLLEIGCGTGHAIAAILERRLGVTMIGLDRSSTALDRAAKVNSDALDSGVVGLVKGDIDRDVPTGGPFDRIFSICVNSFWTKPRIALKQIVPVLKTPGELWIIYDGFSAKVEKPILDSMIGAGMKNCRINQGRGAFAIIGESH